MKGENIIDNKLETISNLFEDKEIRSIWDSEKEEYFFSVVDVIRALTDSKEPRKYWSVLKNRLKKEGSELTTFCSQLKMLASDGKMRLRDVLDTKGILRLIESVPSPKAEPFKGYSDEWIKARLTGIVDRFKLTDVWKDGEINKTIEYALLTNEIYKGWSGMKASEYKKLKGIRKESLRDNMTDIEVALTNIGEIATRDIAREERPHGLKENLKVAKRGGGVAKGAKDLYEKETKKSAISKSNSLNYKYIDEVKKIDNKEGEIDE